MFDTYDFITCRQQQKINEKAKKIRSKREERLLTAPPSGVLVKVMCPKGTQQRLFQPGTKYQVLYF
jgi:hypothetical protein